MSGENSQSVTLMDFGKAESIESLININVLGRMFTVPLGVLTKHPDSLLGNPEKIKRHYDPKADEYYFNRVPECFPAILYYYQTGELRIPPNTDLDTFLSEITFFQLGKRNSPK